MEKELDEKLNKIGKDIQNPEKKSKTLNVISKRISTPIGILIIVLATTIAGGGILFFYKSVECYSSVDCENRPHIMCVGEWGCVDHKCIWNCETKEITEDETADWQTYTNEEYGFEIKYPEDWQVVAIPSKTVEIQIKRSASDSYFEIIENINENKLTLDEWFEESTIINGKPTIKAAAQPVFINDVKAYRLDSELEPPNPLFEIVGIADSQRRIFSLYAYSKQSTDNKILEQILSTFRFIEEKINLYYYNQEKAKEIGDFCSFNALLPVERTIFDTEESIKNAIELLIKENLTESELDTGFLNDFPIKFGLEKGIYFLYEIDLSNIDFTDYNSSLTGLKNIIERRFNNLGMKSLVQDKKIIDHYWLTIELPETEDSTEVVKLIEKVPYLEFREQKENFDEIILKQKEVEKEKLAGKNMEEIKKTIENWELAFEEPFKSTNLTGKYLERAEFEFSSFYYQPLILLQFNDRGSEILKELTKENIGKPLAVYIDDFLITSPIVNEEISDGRIQIVGGLTEDEAKVLVQNFNAIVRPIPIKLISQQKEFKLLNSELKDGVLNLQFNNFPIFTDEKDSNCWIPLLKNQIEKTAKQFSEVKEIRIKPEQ